MLLNLLSPTLVALLGPQDRFHHVNELEAGGSLAYPFSRRHLHIPVGMGIDVDAQDGLHVLRFQHQPQQP